MGNGTDYKAQTSERAAGFARQADHQGLVHQGGEEVENLSGWLTTVPGPLDSSHLFMRFQFDCAFVGDGMIDRAFFEVPVDLDTVAGLRLTEGHEMALIEAERIVGLPDMIGHDGFALYLYLQQHRIRPAGS